MIVPHFCWPAVLCLFVATQAVADSCPGVKQSGSHIRLAFTIAEVLVLEETKAAITLDECPIDLIVDPTQLRGLACVKGARITAEGTFDACAAYLDADCVETFGDTLFDVVVIECTPSP